MWELLHAFLGLQWPPKARPGGAWREAPTPRVMRVGP